jgi:hypothetical protein
MMFKANDATKRVLEEFLQVLRDDWRLVTDAYHDAEQCPGFQENRHDQSIFSLLRKRHGTVLL